MIDLSYLVGSALVVGGSALVGISARKRVTARDRIAAAAAAITARREPLAIAAGPAHAPLALPARRVGNSGTGWNRGTGSKPTIRERIFGEDHEGATLDYAPKSEMSIVYNDLTPTSELPSRPLTPATRVPTLVALDADVRQAFDARWNEALAPSRIRLERLEASLDHPHPVRAYREAVAEDATLRIDEIRDGGEQNAPSRPIRVPQQALPAAHISPVISYSISPRSVPGRGWSQTGK